MASYEFKPDKYSSHMRIISTLSGMPAGMKVLDVGCNDGYIGMNLPMHTFYGIEYDPDSAKRAHAHYKDVKVADLDSKIPNYPKGSFDAIIIGDVLEHLKNPHAALKKFASFLKKDGIAIISLPNVGHLYARLRVLFGNFDYDERGVFDCTHLHFYTLKTMRQLLLGAGLSITKEQATPLPLPKLSHLFAQGRILSFAHHLNYLSTMIWKRLFAIQFVFVCTKSANHKKNH